MSASVPIKLCVTGGHGRLGAAIVRLASEDPGFVLSGVPKRGEALQPPIEAGDAVVDVTHHELTSELLRFAVAAKKPFIIGTTGHTDAENAAIAAAAGSIPVILAPNFSVGVNLLFHLARKAAEVLGSAYDQEIVEMHHRNKLDAPSGTAKRLAEILVEVKGRAYKETVLGGRTGDTGKRTADEIAVHALRGGDVVGDHTVVFAGIGERIELTHKASTRDTFAVGALRAARWIVGRAPGLYSMQDVLGLK